MEGFRIKVRAIRPDQSVHFRVNFDLIEELQIVERSKHLAAEDRAEIYEFLAIVIEADAQCVGRFDSEGFYSMNRGHL